MRFNSVALICLLAGALVSADEPQFSGPQVGESLSPFQAHDVFDEQADAAIDVVDGENNSPLLLVFVHKVTRPSVALSRLLMEYANTKEQAGLEKRLVFLTNDPPDTEAWFRRARHALPKGVSPLISVDGLEGPGAYGLNRKMTMTILVANEGKVTANFPLVQPSIQVDAPKIGHAIIKALGGQNAPTLEDMGFKGRRMRMQKKNASPDLTPEQQGVYRQMMSPVIQKTATPAEVAAAAKAVEDFAAKNPWFENKVRYASNLIVSNGKLANYGTPKAQEFLKKWAKEFAPPTKTRPGTADPKAN